MPSLVTARLHNLSNTTNVVTKIRLKISENKKYKSFSTRVRKIKHSNDSYRVIIRNLFTMKIVIVKKS